MELYKEPADGADMSRAKAMTSTSRLVASVSARATVQLLAGRGCLIVCGYIISVILARGLGPIEYGLYGVTLSVLVWIEMLMGSGILGATAKLIPQYGSEGAAVEEASRILLVIMSLVLFFLCWITAPVFERLFDIAGGATLFRLAILDIPFSGLYFAYQGVLHGQRRFGALSIGLIVYSISKLFAILFLSLWELSVAGALVANALATVAVLLYLTIRFPPLGNRPSLGVIKALLRVGFPIGLYLVTYQVLLSLDLWSLKSLWTGPGEVIGVYVAASNIAKVLGILPAALSSVLFVSLAVALSRKDETAARGYIRAATRFAIVVLFPLAALIALNADMLMVLLFSHAYGSGGPFLTLQVIAFTLSAFLDIFFQALMAAGKHYQSAGILVALVPMAWLLNLMMIPHLGAVGAAVSLVLTVTVGAVLAAVLVWRRFGSVIGLATLARVSAATALTAVLGMQIPAASPWLVLKFSLLLGLYTLLLSWLKELNWQDLRAFALWQKATDSLGEHK